ncbi:MAG: glucose dehydrogenase, partial [Dehalococcoidia bacterium]
MRRFFVFLLPLTLIAACGNGGDGRDQSLATRTVVPGLAADSSATAAPGPGVQLLKVASGFRRPTYVTHAGDGSGRLFVVEKAGTIRVVQDGTIAAEPFLDITPLVGSSGNEQGLLGLAF